MFFGQVVSKSKIDADDLRNVGKTLGDIKTKTYYLNYFAINLDQLADEYKENNYTNILELEQGNIYEQNVGIERDNEQLDKKYIT